MNQPENTPESDAELTSDELKKLKQDASKKKRADYMKVYLVTYRKPYYDANRDVLLQNQKKYNSERADHIRQVKANWYKNKKAKAAGALMQSSD